MPDPALPTDTTPAAPAEPGHNYTRTFHDLQGRPYRGTLTLRQTTEPYFSAEADIVDGRVALTVPPGLYKMKAMLRDAEGARAFIAEDINVRVQEDS